MHGSRVVFSRSCLLLRCSFLPSSYRSPSPKHSKPSASAATLPLVPTAFVYRFIIWGTRCHVRFRCKESSAHPIFAGKTFHSRSPFIVCLQPFSLSFVPTSILSPFTPSSSSPHSHICLISTKTITFFLSL